MVGNRVIRPHLEYFRLGNQGLVIGQSEQSSSYDNYGRNEINSYTRVAEIYRHCHDKRDTKTMIQMDKYNVIEMHPMEVKLD